MAENKAKKIKEHTVNFKINTRIIITSVLAIVIPTVIIIAFAAIFINITASNFDFSSVTTNSYSIINQVQWDQTINELSAELIKENEDDEKLDNVESLTESLENLGSLIYIERNGSVFYSTASENETFEKANSIIAVQVDKNSYYFGESGLVIINHAQNDSDKYIIIIVNDHYSIPNITPDYGISNITGILTTRTMLIVGLAGAVFILAIIVISLITSKTIVDPIQKITRGANELANGNLDYEIDYKSTNELGLLADSFNEMRLKVKDSIDRQNKADQKQKEMIAGIAHDLRTPLTSIKGYVEGLRDGIADTPEKRKRYLDTIYSSTCDTEKMLNDLLTISKLELGNITLNLEKVSIADFTGFASEIGSELKKAGFDFEIVNNSKTDPVLSIDTDRFARVIDNIISNSIKYQRPDIKGKIILTINEYEHSVIFEIKDNGMGVDKKSLPRIFDTLYRADKARTNVSEGSGLGLSVCRQIVELHGGMIWAQSEAGMGLSIFISLPIEKEEEI